MRTSILFKPYGLINGSLLDCFECFLYAFDIGLNVRLCLLDDTYRTPAKLSKLYNERYIEGFAKGWENSVTVIPTYSIDPDDNIVVFDYSTLRAVQPFLPKEARSLFISNVLKRELNDWPDGLPAKEIWCERFDDMLGDTQYTMKFPFHAYKPIEMRQPIAPLLCAPGLHQKRWYEIYQKGWYFEPDSVEAKYIMELTGCGNNVYYKSSSKDEFNQLLMHMNSLLYFQSPYVYDRKPRIFCEAAFYGVKIMYFPLRHYTKDVFRHRVPMTIYDGSTYRYQDVLVNGIETRYYSESDKLIQWVQGV